MLLFKRDDYTVTIHENEKMKNDIFNYIVKWMEKENFWSGEDIQCDDFVMDSPGLVAEIIDNIIKPKVENDEDI